MSNQLAEALRLIVSGQDPRQDRVIAAEALAEHECEVSDKARIAMLEALVADREKSLRKAREALAAHEAAKPESDRVPMPQNADQAVGMVSLGIAWLKEHAPERLAAPVAVASQWQPIETAPKDGRRVLIHMPRSGRKVLEAYWATPYDGAPDDQCWWSTPRGVAGRGYTILQKAVTHWMPLPPAPKEQA